LDTPFILQRYKNFLFFFEGGILYAIPPLPFAKLWKGPGEVLKTKFNFKNYYHENNKNC